MMTTGDGHGHEADRQPHARKSTAPTYWVAGSSPNARTTGDVRGRQRHDDEQTPPPQVPTHSARFGTARPGIAAPSTQAPIRSRCRSCSHRRTTAGRDAKCSGAMHHELERASEIPEVATRCAERRREPQPHVRARTVKCQPMSTLTIITIIGGGTVSNLASRPLAALRAATATTAAATVITANRVNRPTRRPMRKRSVQRRQAMQCRTPSPHQNLAVRSESRQATGAQHSRRPLPGDGQALVR